MKAKFTHKEMEDRLPDYIFRRLEESEIPDFESSLEFYPDLEKEIVETRAVFSRLEKMDIDKAVERHSRNTLPKVNSRLASRNRRIGSGSYLLKYMLPAVTVGLAAYLFFIKPMFNTDSDEPGSALFSKSEEQSIMSDIKEGDDLDSAYFSVMQPYDNSYLPDYFASVADIESEMTDSYAEDIIDDPESSLEAVADILSPSDAVIGLDNFDEDDFQSLLEDIQNAKVTS